MKIIFAGGGTAGSIMPLLAIAEEITKQHPETEILFIGTRRSEVEKRILSRDNFKLTTIFSGKIRRYFDWRNISDIFCTIFGFFQSLLIIFNFKPDIVVGAGGYISVPAIWAAWIMRKKILIHQQDIKPSLSNILTRSIANRITVTFEKSLNDFSSKKTVWTGNPIRREIQDGNKDRAFTFFHLQEKIPIVLVIGGGTGAVDLNKVVNRALPELVNFCQIIHITGINKRITGIHHQYYQQHEFLSDALNDILLAADLIISRAGLSILTELSFLKKAAVLIPLAHSHQEINAQYFSEREAAVVIKQNELTAGILVKTVNDLLKDSKKIEFLSNNISGIMKLNATQAVIDEIFTILK